MEKKNRDIKIKRITVNLNDPKSFPKWNVNQKILEEIVKLRDIKKDPLRKF